MFKRFLTMALALCLLLGALAGYQSGAGSDASDAGSTYTPTIDQPFEQITWGMTIKEMRELAAAAGYEIQANYAGLPPTGELYLPYDVLVEDGTFAGLELVPDNPTQIRAIFSGDQCVVLELTLRADDDETALAAISEVFGEPMEQTHVGSSPQALWYDCDDLTQTLTDEERALLEEWGYRSDAPQRYLCTSVMYLVRNADGNYWLTFVAGTVERCEAEIPAPSAIPHV